jgi:hypothetical protein
MSQQVTVDDEGQLRLLPQDDLQKVTDLGQSCDKFVTGMSDVYLIKRSILTSVSRHAPPLRNLRVCFHCRLHYVGHVTTS